MTDEWLYKIIMVYGCIPNECLKCGKYDDFRKKMRT